MVELDDDFSGVTYENATPSGGILERIRAFFMPRDEDYDIPDDMKGDWT